MLVGHPFDHENVTAVMKADTLTQPSFSRSGDEVWVVQNGATQPEVYRVTTTTGTPTWTRVPAPPLAKIGKVTALALSPDGVRLAIVADGKLYLGSIAPVTAGSDPAGPSGDRATVKIDKLSVLRDDLADVVPVTFQNSTTLLVGARGSSGVFRTVYQVGIDGESIVPVTSNQIQGDVDAIAASSGDRPMLISFGPPDRVWQLSGSITGGEWVSPGGQLLAGTGPFYPD